MTRGGLDASISVFVLSFTPNPRHHGPVGIARSAGRVGIAVYGVQSSRLAPGAMSRYMRGGVVLPRPATTEQWIHNLDRIGRRLGRAVLVPVDDASSVFVDEHADALAEHFLFPRRRPELSTTLGSKRELHLLCERLGIASPQAAFPADAVEACERADELGYPVVLKRIAGWSTSGGVPGPSVKIAGNRDDVVRFFAVMRGAEVEPNVMLQEYIPGPPESVWMFNGYFDGASEPLVRFTGRKIRQQPPYTGATTLGVCAWNADVDRDACRLLREVGYRGIVDLGFRYDCRDGRYKLLDVNPRIGATFRLFVGDDGMDVLRALYLDLTGQPVPPTRQREGRRWIVGPSDLSSSITYLRDGALTPAGWARSLVGVQEGAWFAADDPLPAARVLPMISPTAAARLAARLRRTLLTVPGDGATDRHPCRPQR